MRYTLYPKLLRYRYRLGRMLNSALGRTTKVEMSSFVGFYEKLWREAAETLAADFSEIAEGVWEVRHKDRITLIHNYVVQLDDPVILDLAGNKALCYRLLRKHNLPVPDHRVYRLHELPKAQEFMERGGKGCFVVKPSEGTSGARGITLYVRTFSECLRASALASLYGKDILIERFIPGESYRLLVLDGKLIHATRRRGRRVTGDGRSTVRQLLDREHGRSGVLEEDPDCRTTLAAQDLTGQSVPEAGRELLARSSPLAPEQRTETRTVFNEDATGFVCKEIKEAAEQAARALGSRFAGVDMVTVDPALPLGAAGGAINEINTTPGLHHHYNLRNGQETGPAVTVLKYLLGIADN